MIETELDSNITLSGFKDLSKEELVTVKQVIGTHGQKLADNIGDLESTKVTLKVIHKTEGSEKYELNAKIIARGQHYESEVVDRDLFVGLDAVMQKVSEHAIRESEKLER